MIVETVVALLLVWLTWSVISSYVERRKMPPGPFPFPFVGNFPQMLCDPADPFSKLAEEHGDIYTLSFPTGNTVVLNTASLAREARLGKRRDLVGKSPESMYPFNVTLAGDFATLDYSPKYVFLKKVFLSGLHQIQSGINHESSAGRAIDAVKILLEEIESNEEFRAHLETYQPNVIRDLTDSFISALNKELPKHDGKDVGSLEAVPGLMIDVFFAGQETSSSTLTWFILYMVLHKDVQEKVHKEIIDVVGEDRNPELYDVKNMPYLQAVLCEVLRISSAVPFIGTSAVRDTTIAGYHIPKGTLVALNLARVHRDEREWPEPDVFKPERFLDSEKEFVGWTKLHRFMPFGLGGRE